MAVMILSSLGFFSPFAHEAFHLFTRRGSITAVISATSALQAGTNGSLVAACAVSRGFCNPPE